MYCFFIDKEVLMLKKFAITFFAASTALLLSGCHSAAWYQNRAVERARAYLLEHSRDLTQAQIDFVRFNDPILLKAPIYSGAEAGGMTVGLGSELNQICVAWQIPDVPELVMVYGTSNSQMEYWYPERLIRKNFITHNQEFMTAVNNARNYAESNLVKTLTPLQLNQIRFTAPTLYLTDFPASADPQGTLTPEESAKIEKSRQTALQVSLVWKKEPGKVVLFCGYFAPGFNGWDVNFAGEIPEDELTRHTVKKLRSPADIQKPATAEEKALFPAAAKQKEVR
jgi:hypothetical protein